MLPEERILIDIYLKKIGREDLKTDKMYDRSYEKVIALLELKEWDEPRFAPLLTSNIWNCTFEEVLDILLLKHPDNKNKLIWDDKRFAKLLTSNIWNSNYENVKGILFMKHPNDENKLIWDDKRFSRLLTSSIWATNAENVKTKLSLPFWNNPLYQHILCPSIWTISVKRIEDSIRIFEELKLESFITANAMRKSPIQIKALYHYLIENGIPVVRGDRLNPLFNVNKTILKKRYGIDLDILVAQEKERQKI